jgi:ABC-type multidrug transport system fused ATPase/permease subunit
MKAKPLMADTSFIKEESAAKGVGLLSLNWRMFRSFPLFLRLLPLAAIAIVLSSTAPSVFRWYSANFSNRTSQARLPFVDFDLAFTLKGLVLLTAAAIAFRVAAWALFEISGMWSSQRIHAAMVKGLSFTRTTFFDENPSARLINRLIRDFDEVRSSAIIFVGDLFNVSIEIASIAVVASFANPWAGLLVIPMLSLFAYVQFHRSRMLDHARTLSAIATGHVLARKNDLIEGREIFLLYGRGQQLLTRMTRRLRTYVQASALAVHIEVWASFWIRIFTEAFSFAVLILMATPLANGELEPALAGVIISCLFGITGVIGWLDFASSYVARSVPHVRRVFEFVDLPREEKEEGRRSVSQASPFVLPPEGAIEFMNYSMSYRGDTPVILSNLNLRIPLGSKTALAGRTGSGKTSLIQGLLRMVYVQEGDIRIAGRSIFDMDVHELRRLFGVVPQFPYLFAGTVRSNLDRLGVLPREQLQSALDAVGLKLSLDQEVAEGGQNLSLGERQLVCLARVIAADRPIILMDEPTSGLDPETDARISVVLATSLKDKTVLTIAHRKESLGRYDRVVEMSAGQILKARESSAD